jgi:hypothetical protein
VRDHANKLLKIEQKYGFAATDKWNFDQTGFRIGVGGVSEVITSIANKKKRLYISDPDNRTHLTAIECCNATGVVLPLCLFIKARLFSKLMCNLRCPGIGPIPARHLGMPMSR